MELDSEHQEDERYGSYRRNDSYVAPVQVEDDEEIEVVKYFTYLGSTSPDNGDVMEDVRSRKRACHGPKR